MPLGMAMAMAAEMIIPTAISDSMGIPSETATPTMSTGTEGQFFDSELDVDTETVTLNQNVSVSWVLPGDVNAEQPTSELALVLCQTNASASDPLTASNTWSIVKLPCK